MCDGLQCTVLNRQCCEWASQIDRYKIIDRYETIMLLISNKLCVSVQKSGGQPANGFLLYNASK